MLDDIIGYIVGIFVIIVLGLGGWQLLKIVGEESDPDNRAVYEVVAYEKVPAEAATATTSSTVGVVNNGYGTITSSNRVHHYSYKAYYKRADGTLGEWVFESKAVTYAEEIEQPYIIGPGGLYEAGLYLPMSALTAAENEFIEVEVTTNEF